MVRNAAMLGLAGALWVGCAEGDGGFGNPTTAAGVAGAPQAPTADDPAPTPDAAPEWEYRGSMATYGVSFAPVPTLAIQEIGGPAQVVPLVADDGADAWTATGSAARVERLVRDAGCYQLRLSDATASDPRLVAGAYLVEIATGLDQRCAADPSPGCGPGMLQCGNGACVEDPNGCDAGAPPPCAIDEVVCPDQSCVAAQDVCDGFPGCQGGEDELGCAQDPAPTDSPPPACDEGSYACADGTCIVAHFECDGVADCAAGEDEAGQASCLDGGTVSCAYLCDGIDDCLDASDEALCT
ncbi:MAG: LDL receptor domain-containing protein [Myxococcota bacterium]